MSLLTLKALCICNRMKLLEGTKAESRMCWCQVLELLPAMRDASPCIGGAFGNR